ncbi:hypothetical protein QZH41_017809 [Actinostola sp. cb2023]|nr:hypothetical protein QZH41_017809 [Actinostola sp. cb2023]
MIVFKDYLGSKQFIQMTRHRQKTQKNMTIPLNQKLMRRRRASVIIRDAVEIRLRMIIPYMDSWPKVMRLMTIPQNAPDALKAVSYMVDDIWYHAGDTSTDINWYTKRGVLAALYGATELYMVRDRSEDFMDTWSFLDKRLEDMKQLAKMKDSFQKTGTDTVQLLFAALTTVRNMTGFNRRSR